MSESLTTFLVEDDLVDVLTLKRAMSDLNIPQRLQVAPTGEDAVEMLAEADGNLPQLILLDLNMPCMNGIELLTVMKEHPVWRRIPVVILTTSAQEQERERCFELGAAGYIIKPVDYDAFVEVVRVIYDYWCASQGWGSRLPTGCRRGA